LRGITTDHKCLYLWLEKARRGRARDTKLTLVFSRESRLFKGLCRNQ
jgi:hypothetical protein